MPRAILFARAIATSMRGFRASMRANHDPPRAGLRDAQPTTAIAPMISNRRISLYPIFEVLPRTCLPPLECCNGTRPSQAAKFRPFRKLSIAGAKVLIASAVTGPTPGIVLRRRAVSLSASSRAMRLVEKPDLTLDDLVVELADRHGITIHRVSVWRFLRSLGLTHKKRPARRAIDAPLVRAVAHRCAIGSSPMGDGERAEAA